ncbi:MAG TPA: helix-turn-helix transcriptional regulator [Gaiellaceae bacterium]|jgi:AraC-like DNA-binding protein|nr:helix-turn-helix transcriptional regulator [Gaiellaceae bacterium]
MELEHHERNGVRWQVARRLPAPALRPLLGQALEGWAREGQNAASFQELPFPGIPLILNLAEPWRVDGTSLDSFLAGLHTGPTTVTGEQAFSCLELRLTPLGTRRLLGRPLHELADRSVPLEELLPGTETLAARLRDAPGWEARFDLVETFLSRRLADSPPPPRELEWAWRQLMRSGGQVRVRALALELGWSPRRLIDRFRDHVGLPPKAVARVIRFNRAVTALSSGTPRIAEVAAACGYADQAHLARDVRALGGITPGELARGNFVQDAADATA